MTIRLQPLRIPAGWLVGWNTLFEIDPSAESIEQGYFSGSSLFSATHKHRRFWMDVEWRPEDDSDGCYRLRIKYAPWERSEGSRRCKGVELSFQNAEVVYEVETPLRAELIRELEAALVRCVNWVVETS